MPIAMTDAFADCQDSQPLAPDDPRFELSGATVRRLMRQRGLTIRALAATHKITMKRIREVRADGVRGFQANEWHWILTNRWLDAPQ